MKIVISGAGAAGSAVAKMLGCVGNEGKCQPFSEIIVCDSKGAIWDGRMDLNESKIELAKITNPKKVKGTIAQVLAGADAFIGVSAPGIVSKEMVSSMKRNAIVLAMANPVPEIMPRDALDAGALVVGSGRSDFPNQVNNSLSFPGVFRGALDARAKRITQGMKSAAASALSGMVKNPTPEKILPSMFDEGVAQTVAEAVKATALGERYER
jgi:malate dehydrogenase (oxaloacetate-decarboxylating)